MDAHVVLAWIPLIGPAHRVAPPVSGVEAEFVLLCSMTSDVVGL